MRYCAIFHANLNYAFLEPHKYERTIRASYETIIDTFREKHPSAKYVFEASGYTIDQMAKLTPDVLSKLKDAVAGGQCEFMGSPYAHPMPANFPEEDGRWANEFAQRAYEKHLGFRAESAWNPECSWTQYVPRTFRDAGFKYLTLDFESYKICNDKEYGWVERNRARDMGWGGNLPWYDLDPLDPALRGPFRDVVPGLHGFCRSDRVANKSNSYFLGRLPLEEWLDNVRRWTGGSDEGALVIIADDAEYMGTTGYFHVKHFKDYSRSFDADPGAGEKLDRLVAGVLELGEMVTFKECCEMEPVDAPYFVEDRFAWHRTYADAWASTPESKRYDPVISGLRYDYKDNVQSVAESRDDLKSLAERFWFHLTNAENSDGRWPPPPAETCPFNREWVEKEIESARNVLAELKKKVSGARKPAAPPEPEEEEAYGYRFTEKPLDDLANLNWYELHHALYAAFAERDKGDAGSGRRKIEAVYAEYARRGATNVAPMT